MFVNVPLVLAQNDAPPAPVESAPTTPTAGGPAAPAAPGQTSTVAPGGAAGPAATQQSGAVSPLMQYLPYIVVIVAAMMLLNGGSGRKEKKKRESMLAALKRGDRVQTIGGIFGSVVKIGDDDVVLRVDDAESESKGSTRVRFARSAIQTVLVQSEEPKDDEPKSENA